MLILLALMLISPTLILAGILLYSQMLQSGDKPFASHSDEENSSQVSEGKPGPWGRLLYAHLKISIPDEFVSLPAPDQTPARWFFRDYTKEQVLRLFSSAGLTQAQIDKFLPEGAWQAEANGTRVAPGDELIMALSPEARLKIYSLLLSFAENAEQLDILWFRPETLDKQLQASGLAQSSIKLLKKLLYHNGSSLLLFADRDTALRQIPDDSEKRRFVKAITSKATLMVRLKIDADTDVESLANYWGMGGRRKDILPLISSLQHVEGGWNLNVIYLVPQFIRTHLYTYPFPSPQTAAVKQDCFWSAFNAFNEPPDDRFGDMQYVREVVEKEYYNISQPSQLGDIVFIADVNNVALHVAVYIADDIVFTKNGFHHTQPWILMHLDDMIETYSVSNPAEKELKVLYYRKKIL